MKRKTLLLTMLLAFAAPWAAMAQTALPWSENFEGYTSTTLGSEWATPAMYGGKPCVLLNNAWPSPAGENSLECRTNSSNPIVFVFPQFDKNLNWLNVQFKIGGHANGRGEFGYVTNANDASTFTKLTDISQPAGVGNSPGYSSYNYDLSTMNAPANSSYRLAVRYTFTTSEGDSWYFDDFRVTYTEPSGGDSGDGLTVYDGTATSQKVPMYVNFFDYYTRSQFVIPAADLTDMAGGTINSIKFYTTNSNIPYTTVSDFDIYVKEVNYTTITALEAKSSATIVYQGNGNFVTEGSGGSITITFSTPFTYNGGNLLIGCDNTTNAGYKDIYFYGQVVTGASTGTYNSSLDLVGFSQQNFIPKTTFTYEIPTTTTSTITVSAIGDSYGTVSGGGDYENDSQQTIIATAGTNGYFYKWSDGNTNASRTITVSGDASYTAIFMPKEIANATDWNNFAAAVNGTGEYSGNDCNYSGKTVTMTGNVGSTNSPVTTMAGSFHGTFNGQGKTITINLTGSEERIALFHNSNNATFMNLRIEGSINSSKERAASLVGYTNNSCTVTNCISAVSINSTYSGEVKNGGLIGELDSWSHLTMEGCAFIGSFNGTDAWGWGGLVGFTYGRFGDWMSEGQGATSDFTNCVFAPTSINVKNNSSNPCAIFSYGWKDHSYSGITVDANTCFYNEVGAIMYKTQGTRAYSVTGTTGVTVEMNGIANPTYDVSGLSFYNSGIAYTNKDNETIVYASSGKSVSLNLNTTNSGHQRFLASAGTLTTAGNPYTLTMPSSDVKISSDYKTFITDGNWNTANCWSPAAVPTIGEDVKIAANVTIPSGVATANNIIVNSGKTITIADGGQLQHNSGNVDVIMEKEITGYTGDKDNYYFFASPATNSGLTASSYGLTTGTYDLYTFDYDNVVDNQLLEWKRENGNTNITRGVGYLYANGASKTITTPSITVTPSNANYDVNLNYDASGTWRFNGWNLIGNPFACNASVSGVDFYVINGDEVKAATNNVVAPMQGIFAQATTSGQSATFSRATENSSNNTTSSVNLILKPADTRDAKVIDLARVRFGEGEGLEKFQLNPSHTKIYIPQNGMDYAVVHAQAEGELPVNFKAENNGRYTLSVDIEKVSFDYLHLIDNMTGADVDLLATPTYTFNARTTDYASRFKLVFAATGIEENPSTGSGTFAYNNGSEWVIANPSTGSGDNATLQVIDMMGRMLSSEAISGSCSKAINVAPGVYMLRLVNGNDVKVQKIVVR